MKKAAFIGAACALSVAGVAHAQSSVTLFGVLDAGVRYVKTGSQDQTQVTSGGIATSRIGFRGVEDLGNGLKAGFWLESQINGDNGTADTTKFWGRRSTVSLMGGFGEVRLGRDYSPVYRVILAADPFADTGLGAITSVFSGSTANTSTYAGVPYNTLKRQDNAVSYFTPENLGGFSAVITAAPGEGTTGNKLIGGNIGYKAGPAQILVGYSQTETTAEEDVKNWAVTGLYDWSGVKLSLGFSEQKYLSAKERHANVGAALPLGPGSFKASYVFSQGTGAFFTAGDGVKNKGQKIALGYQYDLSKRTALYTNAAYVKNEGGAAFVAAGGPPAVVNGNSRGVDVGIRHSF